MDSSKCRNKIHKNISMDPEFGKGGRDISSRGKPAEQDQKGQICVEENS